MTCIVMQKPSIVCFMVYFSAIFIASSSLLSAESPQSQLSVELLREIRTEWMQRMKKVHSISFLVDIEQAWKTAGPVENGQAGDPMGPPPVGKTPLMSRIDFFFEDGKCAFFETVLNSEQTFSSAKDWSHVTSQTIAFNNEKTARLVASEQGSRSMGVIEPGKEGVQNVGNYGPLLGANLWLTPERTLENIGWSADRMEVLETNVKVGDRECVRLQLWRSQRPNTGKKPGGIAYLDLDRERRWLPVQWQTFNGQRPVTKIDFEYETHEGISVPSRWAMMTYETGDDIPGSVLSSVVSDVKLNHDIPDAKFEVTFPIGTYVMEKSRDQIRYFVMKKKGLREINASEFGRVSTSDDLSKSSSSGINGLLPTVAVVVVLTVMVGLRHLRNQSV